MIFAITRHCAVALISLCSVLSAAHAQGSGTPQAHRRVPVMLVVVDSLGGDEEYRILRRAEGQPRDLVLLTRLATTGTLSDALHDLLLIRKQQGDTTQTGGTVRIRHPNRSARPEFPWAIRVLSDLRKAQPRAIEGFGRSPAIVIWLPPQRRVPGP